MSLTHRERMQACLSGDAALDRPPVALWRHFPVDDQEAESLAATSLEFQRLYEFDLLKLTPASSFSIRDWGAEDVWEGNPEGTRRYTRRVIEAPGDWEKLPVLSPDSPALARQLACLRLVRQKLPADTPLLQTIFSPLAQAKNLAGTEQLIAHLRLHPQAVMKGLETIARSTRSFVEACLEIGLDGIFYAVQHAQAGLLTLEEYRNLGLPHDRLCLEPATSLWCNMLHLHGLNIYFDLLSRRLFPEGVFQIVNWHDRESPPSLAEALESFPGAVCGGISQKTITLGTATQVRAEAGQALAQTGRHRLLLGTGCVVPVIAPHGNILAARTSVEENL